MPVLYSSAFRGQKKGRNRQQMLLMHEVWKQMPRSGSGRSGKLGLVGKLWLRRLSKNGWDNKGLPLSSEQGKDGLDFPNLPTPYITDTCRRWIDGF